MWKALVCAISLIAFARTSSADHRSQITKEYPFGLIGEDYGLLNEQDLAVNACDVEASPISADNGAYPYWQCFGTEHAEIRCVRVDLDHGEQMVLFSLLIKANKTIDEYVSPHAISKRDCRDIQTEWRKLSNGESFFCVSGQLLKYHQSVGSDVIRNGWIFGKFKTRKGCSSYFSGECDLAEQLQKGCKLPQ